MKVPARDLAALRAVRAPEGFTEGVLRRLPPPQRQAPPRSRWGWGGALAAVFVAGLAVGLWIRSGGARLHEVRIVAVAPGAQSVAVAGSFNGWDPTRTPLHYEGNGRWIARFPLAPGRYPYMLVIDGRWEDDPLASDHRDDGFGMKNAVLTTGL